MAHFDEKSGLVPCATPWGSWSQTIDEVFIEVNVREGTRSKDIKFNITPSKLSLRVSGELLFEGKLAGNIVADESVWTLEDRKLIRLVLVKSGREASNCWQSLLIGQYECDPLVFNEMEKKLTLERFQRENPGFDFSGADISGNYHKGGPQLTADD
ncbi:PREDICTED: nudC domain-containing protein 2-like [Amphimedon queenslandica]|uniref:CS domain-containing protein n=1 Tax=Amphimedon queenslandica TaxID=400682 RepID=A0AAN0IFY8_AMPQE|nr:PREDICTED: nudC domain-containing protein 2-like [Amphimedon queenslandica]|eukprot:XP_003388155.1 PREDICTED: nudC domain-containing protein 2-like [Amphimedon queenslandica]